MVLTKGNNMILQGNFLVLIQPTVLVSSRVSKEQTARSFLRDKVKVIGLCILESMQKSRHFVLKMGCKVLKSINSNWSPNTTIMDSEGTALSFLPLILC